LIWIADGRCSLRGSFVVFSISRSWCIRLVSLEMHVMTDHPDLGRIHLAFSDDGSLSSGDTL
ncbi:hypothetical protein, partial [Candidatus Methylacidiphilum fumarolicum]|uniref:hypothetical protein n=1 Tax=Candidatus Methylacidiphilum fumarolicum TaxID=591154 RepID=UPI001ABC7D9A